MPAILLFSLFLLSCSRTAENPHLDRKIASDTCPELVSHFFALPKEAPVPAFLSKLKSQEKFHPSGKKYIELTADPDVIANDKDYAKFLEETAEILYLPSISFGHIRLRLGTTMYDFKGVKSAGIEKFYPKMKKNKKPGNGPMGFVFKIGADKIKSMQDEVEMMYLNSNFNNIPPYDLYSGMIRIIESGVGENKILTYASTSNVTNLSNKRQASGKIILHEGKYYLESDDGYRVDVIKRPDGFYTQSYSCLSSATHVMEKYFNTRLNYADFPPEIINQLPPDLQKSITDGQIQGGESPQIVIKYFND